MAESTPRAAQIIRNITSKGRGDGSFEATLSGRGQTPISAMLETTTNQSRALPSVRKMRPGQIDAVKRGKRSKFPKPEKSKKRTSKVRDHLKTTVTGITPINEEFSSKLVHRMGQVYNVSQMPRVTIDKSPKRKNK